MVLEAILFFGLFHHKKTVEKPVNNQNAEWIVQRKYIDRAEKGIEAYEADTQYARLEREELDAFEAQFQVAWEEKDSDPEKFIKDMEHLDELGQVLDSLDHDLHRENAI